VGAHFVKPGAAGLLILLTLTPGCLTPSLPSEGICTGTFLAPVARVVDGDTLDAAGCGRVRLALVDSPERGEAGFEEATGFTNATCPVGGEATWRRDAGQPTDTTGTRMVAVVECGGVNLNAALLDAGHARFLPQFCAVSAFAGEEWARPHCRGA